MKFVRSNLLLKKLILNARCHAIRDAQVLDKQQITKEMVDEDERLNMMMEIERRRYFQNKELEMKHLRSFH